MKIDHPKLIKSLKKAYSAERAAAFAYIGHRGSMKIEADKIAIKEIEDDEWGHRKEVLAIMQEYDIPVSKFYELQFYIIGKIIAFSCYVIGWFMPYFFAGKLESGNVCEYFVMMHYFHELDITKHDQELYDMGVKEKEHEVYFLNHIGSSKLMPFFEKTFKWGKSKSYNDIELKALETLENSTVYCRNSKVKTKQLYPKTNSKQEVK